MRKIVNLFKRDWNGNPRLVTRDYEPEALWVLLGDGVIATQKFDGTACMIDNSGKLWKRFDAKNGKTSPERFIAAQDPDEKTGHWPGWVPVGAEPDSKWHREAFTNLQNLMGRKDRMPSGTFELCGPRIQGNPEKFDTHVLVPHGSVPYIDLPTDYYGLAAALAEMDVEGVVWHHPSGRMAKVKKSDFGLIRTPEVKV